MKNFDKIDWLLLALGLIGVAMVVAVFIAIITGFEVREYEYEDFSGEIKHSKVCYRSGSYLYCHGEDKQPIQVVRFRSVEE